MIKVSNSRLDTQTLEIINNFIEQKIKASAAFKLSRIIRELSSIIEDKVKQERYIFDKYCEKDEEGNIIVPNDEEGNPIPNSVKISDINAFNQEMLSLMSIENVLNHNTLSFEEIGLESASVKDIMKIDFLFD